MRGFRDEVMIQIQPRAQKCCVRRRCLEHSALRRGGAQADGWTRRQSKARKRKELIKAALQQWYSHATGFCIQRSTLLMNFTSGGARKSSK